MMTLSAVAANASVKARFAGTVDREAALATHAPITLSGVKDVVDTFLRRQNGTLKAYEVVGPDIRFEVDRPELSPAMAHATAGKTGFNPFTFKILVDDNTVFPGREQVGMVLNRSTRHTASLAMKLFEREGRLFEAASDSPDSPDKGVIPFNTSMLKAVLNMAIGQINPLRTLQGLPPNAPGLDRLDLPQI